LAAVFISLDGFFICYSRTALLDGMLASLMLWSALATVVARSGKDVAVAAILIGLASSVKWTGVLMVIPLTLWLAVLNRNPWRWLLLLAFVPIVHVAVWSFALWVSGQPGSISDVVEIMRGLLVHHLSRTDVTHPVLSRWYTWPILYHPITLSSQHDGLLVRTQSTIGGPFLWGGVTLSVAVTACAAALRLVPVCRTWLDRRVWRAEGEGDKALSLRAVLFALACWASPFLPWILTKRDSYMYHYLPSYGFGLVLLAGIFAWMFRRRRVAAWALVLTACIVSIYFIPVSSQMPLTHKQLDRRLVFELWK
jgi:dolichyl-phosphate-mannose-protein mannosyltransferase